MVDVTRIGRRSDSLFYDNLSRRELCDKIAYLETDLKEAKEELKAREESMEPDGWHKCPKCGCFVGYVELYGGGWSIMMDDYQIPLRFCPECGREIKEVKQ